MKSRHFSDLSDLTAAFDDARCHRQVTIFNLCGLELSAGAKRSVNNRPLLIPPFCTLQNGAICLPEDMQVGQQDAECFVRDVQRLLRLLELFLQDEPLACA